MALAAGREDVIRTLRAHQNSTSYIYPGCTCLASVIRGSRRVVIIVWPVSAKYRVAEWGVVKSWPKVGKWEG